VRDKHYNVLNVIASQIVDDVLDDIPVANGYERFGKVSG